MVLISTFNECDSWMLFMNVSLDQDRFYLVRLSFGRSAPNTPCVERSGPAIGNDCAVWQSLTVADSRSPSSHFLSRVAEFRECSTRLPFWTWNFELESSKFKVEMFDLLLYWRVSTRRSLLKSLKYSLSWTILNERVLDSSTRASEVQSLDLFDSFTLLVITHCNLWLVYRLNQTG